MVNECAAMRASLAVPHTPRGVITAHRNNGATPLMESDRMPGRLVFSTIDEAQNCYHNSS